MKQSLRDALVEYTDHPQQLEDEINNSVLQFYYGGAIPFISIQCDDSEQVDDFVRGELGTHYCEAQPTKKHILETIDQWLKGHGLVHL